MRIIKIIFLLVLIDIVFPGTLLFAQTAKSVHKKDTDIQKIKNTLANWNKTYESKNADKFFSFESAEFITLSGGPEKAKEVLINNYFSKWKQLSIKSTVKSVEKTGTNYVVDETVTFTNTAGDGSKKSQNAERMITFTQENGVWKILNLQNKLMPAVYKKLKSNYKRRGEAGFVYVSHISQDFISVIDTKSDSLIGNITSGKGTDGVAFSSLSGKGYIINYNSNDITVFNKKTNKKVSTVPAGAHPSNILITPDGRFALITHESQDGLWIMSTTDNEFISKIPAISGIPVNDTFNNKIYISAIFSPFVFVLNASDLSLVKQIKTGGKPLGVAISPDGKYAYVANYELNEVEKIDTELDSVVDKIPEIKNGRGIAVSTDNRYVYVTNVNSNAVTVIDLTDNKISVVIPVGKMPTSICIDNENKCAYVSNQGSASISVIDTKTNTVIKTISVADNPIRVQIY